MEEQNEDMQIQIKKKTGEELHRLKALGESYDDVISRLLKGPKIPNPAKKEAKP